MAALTVGHVPTCQVSTPESSRRRGRSTNNPQPSPATTQELKVKFSVSHGTDPKKIWAMKSLTLVRTPRCVSDHTHSERARGRPHNPTTVLNTREE